MNAAYRQMYILTALWQQKPLGKRQLADHFHTSERSIQRDISQINRFFAEEHRPELIKFHRSDNTYSFESHREAPLSDEQLLAIIKILLATRGLNAEEMMGIVSGLRNMISPAHKGIAKRIIENEIATYTPMRHGKPLIDAIWAFSTFIAERRDVELVYLNRLNKKSRRIIKPRAILFSESYFYIIANSDDDNWDRFFRVDRMISYKGYGQNGETSWANRFQDGDFRKLIQFMYAGELETIEFEFWGIAEAALDRLPNAEIIERRPHSVIIRAKVYGEGVKLWLMMQGNMARVIRPQHMVDLIRDTAKEMLQLYDGTLGVGDAVPHFII